jgi:hypothetical protein
LQRGVASAQLVFPAISRSRERPKVRTLANPLKASLERFFAKGKQHRGSAVHAKKGIALAAKNYTRTLLKETRISDRLKQEREKRKEESGGRPHHRIVPLS